MSDEHVLHALHSFAQRALSLRELYRVILSMYFARIPKTDLERVASRTLLMIYEYQDGVWGTEEVRQIVGSMLYGPE